MNVLEFTALVWTGSVIAGLLGSLTGLGGGVVLVPLLTLFFKVDIRYAVGAPLVSVVAIMFGAGALSGLLGIGSGAVKVLAMDQAMRIPFKVSTTTSNFMIGVTAAASAGVYFSRGYIDPGLAMPV